MRIGECLLKVEFIGAGFSYPEMEITVSEAQVRRNNLYPVNTNGFHETSCQKLCWDCSADS